MPRDDSSDYSDDSARRAPREKRDKDAKKSKREKHDKHGKKEKKEKSSKKDKSDKHKDSKRSRRDKRSRSRSPSSSDSGGRGGGHRRPAQSSSSKLSAGLADFDVDSALQQNKEYFKKAMPFLARRIEMEDMPPPPEDSDGRPKLGLEALGDKAVAEAPIHPLLQRPAGMADPSYGGAGGSGGTSTALTLSGGGGLQLIAPDQVTAKRTALATAARECRRVHVSHIPPSLTVAEMRTLFERMCSRVRREMTESEIGRPLPDGASVRVDLVNDVFLNSNSAVPFAFVELSSDDMASQLINGNQVLEFPLPNGGTQRVKCRRPRDYRPMAQADDRRVQLLGLPAPDEHAETVKALFEALGAVETVAVIPNRGFYVEFAQAATASAAVRTLHGEVLGGNVIVVQLATECVRATLLNLGLPVSGLEGDGPAGSTGDLRKDLMSDLLNLQLPLAHAVDMFVSNFPHLKDGWPVVLPTRILCIFNAFDREELTESETSYDKLTQDIEEEVERHGRVRRLIVPRQIPKPPAYPESYVPPPRPTPPTTAVRLIPAGGFDGGGDASSATALTDPSGLSDAAYRLDLERWEAETKAGQERHDMDVAAFKDARAEWERECVHPVFGNQGLGRIFVEYETADEAEEAQRAIAGRLFNGRTIITSFLFEDVLYPPPPSESGDDDDDGANGSGKGDGDDAEEDDGAKAEGSADAAAAAEGEGGPAEGAADDID